MIDNLIEKQIIKKFKKMGSFNVIAGNLIVYLMRKK